MIGWIEDRQVGWEDVGQGDAMLFVHGFPLSREIWAAQSSALVDRARCIVPDLRGFGESSAAEPWSMDAYADDLVWLLDHLHVERAVVCGLSMGGYVSFALWRRHPDRVRALALLGTKAAADAPDALARRAELIELAQSRGSGAVADRMSPGMLGKSSRERNPDLEESVHALLESAPVEGVVGALQAMMAREDSGSTLGTITVPTLIVVGDEDVLTPVDESRTMHAAIPGSRLEIIAGAGHLANVERPAAVNHVLSEFLASLSLQ